MNRKVLIIDDDADICALLSRFLTKNGYETDIEYSARGGIAKFREKNFDIVICDYRLGEKSGKDVLLEVKKINPNTVVIIITGYSHIKTAVDVIKAGAYDYITKPLVPDEVLNVLAQSASQLNTSGKKPQTSKDDEGSSNMFFGNYVVGKSKLAQELFKQVDIVAPTNYSVILYGETGTGKEIIARTIHEKSTRSDKPFVAIDCGVISKELAGSTLFGHVKGAFTDAQTQKEGHFETANHGTIFLDEISNLTYETQANLLRVIQERRFKKVGGVKEMPVDVRIICASNENLQEAVRNGKFREDLYHRLNEFTINVPPLRNRKDDIGLFANFFLENSNAELNKQILGFDDQVMNIFLNYSWPGNLREFRNVMRRAVLLTKSGTITVDCLPAEIINPQEIAKDSYELVSAGMSIRKGYDLKDAASKAEYETIMNVLKGVNFNKSKAAKILNIDRKTLYNKIKNYEESA
jgi:two-component system response regulator HydG